MARDERLERMLDETFVEAAPVLKETLVEKAPSYGVSGESLRALQALPQRRYTKEELQRELPASLLPEST